MTPRSLSDWSPIARIDHDALFPGHRAILVSGQDYMGFNRLTTPPGDT